MKLISLIVPLYNHEKIIQKNFRTIIRHIEKIQNIDYEIIFINDGSTDHSHDEFKKISHSKTIILDKENGGLGTVLKMGFDIARGEIIFYIDFDLSYDITNIKKIIEQLDNWDCIVCSKYLANNNYPPFRTALSYLNYLMIKIFFGVTVRDIGSGLVMVKSKFIKNFNFICDGFGIHIEFFLLLKRESAKIKEIPANYNHIPGSFQMFNHTLQTIREIIKIFYYYKIN